MLPSFVQCHEKQLERVSFSISKTKGSLLSAGADLGGGCRECAPPPPPPEMNCGFLIQLVFFIGVEVEQETSAPPPKKNSGSGPAASCNIVMIGFSLIPRPVRAIRVTREALKPSAIARGVLGEFSRQA